MDDSDNFLSIELLTKDLTIKCPHLLQEKLQLAVGRLEQRLRETKALHPDWSRDDMLAITAVNLMFENVELEQEFVGYKRAITKRANSMLKSIDQLDIIPEKVK
jgi:cell division protein ZapA (FtsZ GTPase activity inhibitor)